MFWKTLLLLGLLTIGVQAGETGYAKLTNRQFNLVREEIEEPQHILGRMLRTKRRLDELELWPVARRATVSFYLLSDETRQLAQVDTSQPHVVEPQPGYLLYFHASWCNHCIREGPHFDGLKKAGYIINDWRTGQQPAAHIHRIDTDKWPDIASKYKAAFLPLFIKMEGSPAVEVDRYTGYLDLQQIQDMHAGKQRFTKLNDK